MYSLVYCIGEMDCPPKSRMVAYAVGKLAWCISNSNQQDQVSCEWADQISPMLLSGDMAKAVLPAVSDIERSHL